MTYQHPDQQEIKDYHQQGQRIVTQEPAECFVEIQIEIVLKKGMAPSKARRNANTKKASSSTSMIVVRFVTGAIIRYFFLRRTTKKMDQPRNSVTNVVVTT